VTNHVEIAVWGHPFDEFAEGEDGPAEILERLTRLREAGVTTYFALLATAGMHYFASRTLGPAARELLRPLTEAALEVGIEIIPVVGLGQPGKLSRGLYEPPLEVADVPEWALSWPCAAWGENHEHAVLIANELIEDYGVSGLQLDYSRFPDAELLAKNPCACERCQNARLRWLGKPYPEPQDLRIPGVAFKELQMRMEFVRSLVESMRGLADHHGITLSVAVRGRYYEDALPEGQDWAEWCADGLVDEICTAPAVLSFGRFARYVSQHQRLTAGCEAKWLEGVGAEADAIHLDLDALERQSRFAASAGADGICVSRAGLIDEETAGVLRELAQL
jgi:hypothetical protein